MQPQQRQRLALYTAAATVMSGIFFNPVLASVGDAEQQDAFKSEASKSAAGKSESAAVAGDKSAASAKKSDSTEADTASQPSGVIDPKADKVLHELADYYQQLKTLSVDIHAVMTVEAPGKRTEVPSDYKVVIEKPNRFKIAATSGRREGLAASNGTDAEFYTSVPSDQYMTTKAPASISEVFARPEFVLVSRGWLTMSFLEPLMVKDPYQDIVEGITKIEYVGEDKVADIECHHLKLTQPRFICDFWVKKGPQPRLVKVSPDLSAVIEKVGEQAPALESAKVSMSFLYRNFLPDVKVTDADFQGSHPSSAKKIESFFEQPKHPLEGKAAPEVTLPLLDGGEVKLASCKNKVVVLHFWATWCAPCIHSLPTLASVLSDQKDAVFYGINRKESRERIHKFLADTGLEFPVVLDADGEIAEKFAVDGLPHTVVIGKDGTIKAVYVGYSPMLKQIITKELAAILK